MDTVFDFAPLWRSGVGFDHLLELAEKAIKLEPLVFADVVIQSRAGGCRAVLKFGHTHP